MNFDGLVFPAPTASYTYGEFEESLFFVPRCRLVKGVSHFDYPAVSEEGIAHIPCYYKAWPSGAPKIILYFHGNAEDIGRAEDFLLALYNELFLHVVAMEYPGYGIYTGSPNEQSICSDALNVYDYITQVLGWKEKDVILFGRSIGTGPATHVASLRNPGMLVLMSAFTSIKDVVKHNACMLSFMVAERFRNIDKISKVNCPKIFLHGARDELVPPILAEQLFNESKMPKKLFYGQEMTHNEFNMWYDLIVPLSEYWEELGFVTQDAAQNIKFKVKNTELPEEYKDKFKHWSCSI